MKLFEPDIFSVVTPVWTTISAPKVGLIKEVLQQFALTEFEKVYSIAKSGSIEINSGNFLITTTEGQFLLKRWGQKQSGKEISKTLGLLHWLKKNHHIPVSPALNLRGQSLSVFFDDSHWSVFRFVTGEYYNGCSDQLEMTAKKIACLHLALKKTPQKWLPENGPLHGTELDKTMLEKAAVQRGEWETIFDSESACLLENNWNYVENAWERTRQTYLYAGSIQPAHFDLHPHNILMSDRNVSAILDFDSCKKMQIGYALAFAGLKLCRQAVVESGGAISPNNAGRRFLVALCEQEPSFEVFVDNFSALAVSEVLRRICLIIRLNIENCNKVWNHVLSTQIGHIGEAQALFGDL